MKRFLLIATTLVAAFSAHAQQVALGPLHSPENLRADWLLPGDTLMTATDTIVYGGKPMQTARPSDPTLLYMGTSRHSESAFVGDSALFLRPSSGEDRAVNGYDSYGWGLHEGLNASLSLSAFATFGRHAPHKGGFGEALDLTYLKSFGKLNQGWVALGGYLNNVNYGGDSYHDAGFHAALGYRFDEHWEAYAYGQLSVTNNYDTFYGRHYGYRPYGYGWDAPAWGMGAFGMSMDVPGANVIGGGVTYHFNPSFSIGINIEGAWYNDHTPHYFDPYNYPVPKP